MAILSEPCTRAREGHVISLLVFSKSCLCNIPCATTPISIFLFSQTAQAPRDYQQHHRTISDQQAWHGKVHYQKTCRSFGTTTLQHNHTSAHYEKPHMLLKQPDHQNTHSILLSQTSAGSQGAREFVFSSYQELKKANPNFPLLVREAEDAKARLVARFGTGLCVERGLRVCMRVCVFVCMWSSVVYTYMWWDVAW